MSGGRWSIPRGDGAGWLRVDAAGTVVFVAVEVVATIWPDQLAVVAAGVSLVLFAVGIVIFVGGFLSGVERSRTEEVSVAGLYFLAGGVAPAAVRRVLMGLLAVQTVVSVAAASIRPFTALAFGILVPMFGLAIAGRWAAEYGAFADRKVLRTKRAVRPKREPSDEEDSRA